MQPTHSQIEWENFNAQWDEKVCISYIFLLLWTMGVSKRPLSLTYVQCIQSLLSSTVFEASWLFPKNIFKRGSMGTTTICAQHIWSLFPENGHQVQPWVARRRWWRRRVKINKFWHQRTCKSQKQQTWLKVSMIFFSPIKMQIWLSICTPQPWGLS